MATAPMQSRLPTRPLRSWTLLLGSLTATSGCTEAELPPPPIASAGSGSAEGDGSSTAEDPTTDQSDATGMEPGTDPLQGVGALELVADGFGQVEGPVWRADTGDLLFTDVIADQIHRLVPPATVEVFRGPTRPPTHTNGLVLDGQGRLLACEHATQRVTRGDMGEEIVADRWLDMSLNSPNDLVVHANGSVLFTDPTYGSLPALGNATIELDFQGVYLAPAVGPLELVYEDFQQPNGIALSPAQDVLYVADSAADSVFSFPLDEDGRTAANMPTLLTDQAEGADGLEVDAAGNLYVATVTGVLVLGPSGTAWGTISTPEPASNLEFGGPALQTLYVAATTSLYRVELAVAGFE